MRLVTIGAHQDDMEVWALGTVLRYLERGDLEALTVICLTNGDKGSATKTAHSWSSKSAVGVGMVVGAEVGLVVCAHASWLKSHNDVVRSTKP